MRNKEDRRKLFHRITRRGGEHTYFQIYGHPEWMTDEQWRQVNEYTEGKAIPTDPEIVSAFRDCTDHQNTTPTTWAYSHVPGYIVGPLHYRWWCELIAENSDQDLVLDVGL